MLCHTVLLDTFFYYQFSSVAQLCPTLFDPMNHSMPGLRVHHQLPESTQTHVHWVGDAIQPSHPLSSPSSPAVKLSQHQGLFKWVSSSHQFSSVQSLSCVRLFGTLWTAARPASLSIAKSRSLLRLMSIESVMPFNHLILCQPLLLRPCLWTLKKLFPKNISQDGENPCK